MKSLTKLFFMMACLSLLFSCEKTDEFSEELSGNDLKSGIKKCGEVIVVNPSGGDDTQALKDAFEEAKQSGPGATVQLLKGTYTIGMIEVHDFNGCFMGAGKGKTIITNKMELPCEEVWEQNALPALLKFIGGDINILNMTFQFQDGDPCLPGYWNDILYGDLACGLVLADYGGTYVPDKRYIKSKVDNVDFIAGNDGGHGVYGTIGNVAMLIYCGNDKVFADDFMPLSTGNISITNGNFKDGLTGPDFWAFDEKSVLKAERNVISGGSQQIFMGSLMGPDVTVKNNTFKNGTWIDLYINGADWGYYPGILPLKESRFTISGNKFESPKGIISIYMSDFFRTADPAGVFPQLYDVKDNVFNNEEGGIAIQCEITKNTKIWNNKFLGTGATGVFINGDEPTGTYAEKNQVIGNNYFGAAYTDAAVYLGPYSKNCKVVGVKSDQVVDMGVNNSVIGTKANKKGVHSFSNLNKRNLPPNGKFTHKKN